ncbi:UbiA prenyltransferase [Aaosphaeria arxii CBS 175.79]|uniref:UbiA prenyltransferase n=1 Tax=Aaosphaeria arxii CBS 175.79 TaxID=1450172 RepID=A0A6A5XNF7_9PLEO|nr:UbiA prenyltransferase [Aaosphaeria arxii CBS 175.79]KAF2014436.1 UbiA prenyltransferase [Aaosphaeria arxii CBS 175.79]
MSSDTKANAGTLAQQYGGNSRSGWVGRLPISWLPYVQLARLSPPAGLFLIYFPHLFGVLHAAIVQRTEISQVVQSALLMLGGSFFVSNSIHIWNDLIDAPLDAKVERTRNRPIPRKAISPEAAFVFTVTQAIGAAVFLPLMTGNTMRNILYAVPSILGWTYYPWAKVHTNVPQLVLGFCLAWGIPMGSLAVGRETIGFGEGGFTLGIEPATLCLILANTLWTMIYDTIYAHQDLKDDIKAGIKSLAVLYRERTKTLLWQLLLLMVGLLAAVGWLSGMGLLFQAIAVGGPMVSLAVMIQRVELQRTESCWWWFGNGFWYAGGAMAVGLGAEYLRIMTTTGH